MNTDHKRTISIVVPVFNEEKTIKPFLEEINNVAKDFDTEISLDIIFINDGSTDATDETIKSFIISNDFKFIYKIKSVNLSRNFGKDVALSAGIDLCDGDAMIPMDVDLQDPPQLINEFIKYWNEGYEVVYATRKKRKHDTYIKRSTAGLFYKIFNLLSNHPIPKNTGDYRLIDKRVVKTLRSMPERDRFMKGIFSWVGYRAKQVEYERPPRLEGETKWNYLKLLKFAIDGVFSFSGWPLRIWFIIGSIVAIISLLYGLYLIIRTVFFGADVPGYPSLIVSILFIGSLNLIGIGMLGEYISRIYNEAKQRPLYIIREKHGF